MAIRTELRDGNQIEVVGDDFAEVVRVFSPSLSREGAFLETDLWLATGSPVRFRLGLADGFALVHALGEVAWRRAATAERPGLAIRFLSIVEGATLIERIVDQHQLEGGEAFRLADEAAAAALSSDAAALDAAVRRDSPAAESIPDDAPERAGGLEILETIDTEIAPSFAPGLGRAGALGADPKVRLSRDVIEALGGAEDETSLEDQPPAPIPPEAQADSLAPNVRSLLGQAPARPDVLTATVAGPPARTPFSPPPPSRVVSSPPRDPSSRPGRVKSKAGPGESAPRGRGPGDSQFDESGQLARGGRVPRDLAVPASPQSLSGAPEGPDGDDMPAPGATSGATGDRLDVDLDALDSSAGRDTETTIPEALVDEPSASAVPPATDPLISASWLLERWDRVAGEAQGPPSQDPALVRPVESARHTGAARARGSGLSLAPLLVLAVLGVAGYLAVQRWYLKRPPEAPAAPRSAAPAEEVAAGAAVGPELESAAPGRTLAETRSNPGASGLSVEVADGALDGSPAGVLERVTWSLAPGETRILLEADGVFAPESVRHLRLPDAPPRELLRIAGILRPIDPARYDIGSLQVRSLRFGFHQQGNVREAHVVIDLTDPAVRLRLVRVAPQRMVLVVAGGPR